MLKAEKCISQKVKNNKGEKKYFISEYEIMEDGRRINRPNYIKQQ